MKLQSKPTDSHPSAATPGHILIDDIVEKQVQIFDPVVSGTSLKPTAIPSFRQNKAETVKSNRMNKPALQVKVGTSRGQNDGCGDYDTSAQKSPMRLPSNKSSLVLS